MCDNYCNISDLVSNATGYSDVIASPVISFLMYCRNLVVGRYEKGMNLQHVLRISTQLYKFPLFCISSDTCDRVAVII